MSQNITIITIDPEIRNLIKESLSSLDVNTIYHDAINKLKPGKNAFIIYDARLDIPNAVEAIQHQTKNKTPVIAVQSDFNTNVINSAFQIEGSLTELSIQAIFKRFWKNTYSLPKEQLSELTKNDLNLPLWLIVNNFKLIDLPILMYNLQAMEETLSHLDWSGIAAIINTKVFAKNDTAQYEEWLEIINNTKPNNMNAVWDILLNSSLCKDHRINAGINELLDAACERGLNLKNIKVPYDTAAYTKSLIAVRSIISGDHSKLKKLLEDEQTYINNSEKISASHEQEFWYGIYHSIIQHKDKDENIAEYFKQFFLDKYKNNNVEATPWQFMKNFNFQYTDSNYKTCIELLRKYPTDVQNLPKSLILWCASDKCSIEQKKSLLQSTGFTILPHKLTHAVSKIFNDIATPDTKELRFDFYKAHIFSEEPLDFSSERLHMCFPEYQTKFKSIQALAEELIITQDDYLNMLRYSILVDDLKNEALPDFNDIFNLT